MIEQSGYIPHPALKDLMLGEPLGIPWRIRANWGRGDTSHPTSQQPYKPQQQPRYPPASPVSIATTSSAEKASKARELGADEVIDYTTEDVAERENLKAVNSAADWPFNDDGNLNDLL